MYTDVHLLTMYLHRLFQKAHGKAFFSMAGQPEFRRCTAQTIDQPVLFFDFYLLCLMRMPACLDGISRTFTALFQL